MSHQESEVIHLSLPSGRNHRTALVIDVRGGVSSDFRDRYQRLLQSVNEPGIMVDVYTLRGDVTSVSPLTSGGPDAIPSPNAEDVDLTDWAADQGYTMLLVASAVAQ